MDKTIKEGEGGFARYSADHLPPVEENPEVTNLDPPPELTLDSEPDEASFAPKRETGVLGKIVGTRNMTLSQLKSHLVRVWLFERMWVLGELGPLSFSTWFENAKQVRYV